MLKDPAYITQEETEYWEDRAEAELGEPPKVQKEEGDK
jgi:hypothetical protein